MKKILIYPVALFFLMLNCKDNKGDLNKEAMKNDTIQSSNVLPKTKITVNKVYDNYGNLISVDSSYSYFYSNIKNDSILEKEIFEKFKQDFTAGLQPIDSLFMDGFFLEAPFKSPDFYTEEFFQDNFRMHQEELEKQFKRMDSIKNSYYKKQIFDKL